MEAESDGPAASRRLPRGVLAHIALALAVAGLAPSLAACGGESSSSSEPPAEFFGIDKGTVLDAKDIQTMRQGGVDTLRFLFLWGPAEPKKGHFVWAPTDQLVGNLAAAGVRPLPFLYGVPAWLGPKPAEPPLGSPKEALLWQRFLTSAVKRYGPGGTYWTEVYPKQHPDADPLPITAWQVWNEPNLPKYFAASPPVEKYAQLLKISRDAIIAQDPKATIVLAGLPGYGTPDTAWQFLGKLYDRPGFKRNYDAVALHPYARNADQLQFEIKKLRSAMEKHGDGQTPLWLTELGWGSGPPNRFGLNKRLSGQAQLLSQSFELITKNRETWHVQRVFWFDWRDPPKGAPQSCSFCSTAGLLKNNREPKPSWSAYMRFSNP